MKKLFCISAYLGFAFTSLAMEEVHQAPVASPTEDEREMRELSNLLKSSSGKTMGNFNWAGDSSLGSIKGARWSSFSLSGSLSDSEFNSCTFENARLIAKFANVRFKAVTFKNVIWEGSDLHGASFEHCIGAPE